MSIDTDLPIPRRADLGVPATAARRRRLLAWGALLFAVLSSPGCVWLQNEFFVWDAAPPADPLLELPATEDPRGW